ncbi:EAL domain-containing protein [Methylotenera sp.]|uniref:EAL domain-containing protein n=2 Tax=Methylotenera sp. TaxID=2051956 RepID=UPI0027253C72|nr:EAL domain-containing protein [Methylotenera sp.]MDO9204527.1 EAL domain-containing protein [Methylotenera sp.]MDP1523217.1 EAL domain-containing protein [Methylotenera sp.]MDP2230405.1 EAL domain-containing protein [Methylotenera sp.]MDP3141657.1 EAL domain-containing protein [Methylotenera sp.]MDP3306861.1 EAL domain-containing protein [Methylotenera sp.]
MAEKHFTGLRAKMLVVVAAGMILLFTILFLAARMVLLDGYSKLESNKTVIQVNSAVTLLKEQTKQLDGIVSEYAHWDDTYQYMIQPDSRYIESNYTDGTFTNLKVKAIVLVNSEGEAIYKRGFDFSTGKLWPIPKLLEQAVSKDGLFLDPSKDHLSGFFWTPEGIYIVSATDVLPSGGNGLRRGTLIMVRHLDQSLIAHVEQIIGANLTIEPMLKDRFADMQQILANNGVVVKPLSDTQVAGYAMIKSVDEYANLVVTTLGGREIFAQGEYTLSFLSWATSIIALMLAGISWIFDRMVLLRLERMSEDVKRIGESANTKSRVRKLNGQDELASLSNGINGMLDRIEDSQYELQLEKDRAQVTLEGIADAVITSNEAGFVLYMNAAAERLTGVDLSEVKTKTLWSLFRLMAEDKTTPVNSTWLTDSYSVLEEVILERADGAEFVIRKSASPLYDSDGNTFAIVTVLHDVTMLRNLSNQLSFQARHDQLTGLINRYEFDRKTQIAIDDAATENRIHCLAYIDLDQFKIVNDTCGHMAGDVLLKQLSNHIKAKVRSSDTLARLGGDEFALLLMGCDLDKAQEIIESLLQVVREYRFTFDDKVFKIGASVGLTEISPSHNLTLSELLSTVDSACYTAKEEGGNRIHVYRSDDKDIKEHNNQLEWVSRIHLGLEKKQFVLYIQRMESLTAGAELHCELLIRMQAMDGSYYPPGYFLPAAERYHLMPIIDRWVVGEALSIIARKGASFPYVCAINLSGQTLSEEGFLEYVIEQIKLHKVNTSRICFEITETSVIANLNKARQFMHALREIGCRFSLDDFGSGLSSFAYLKNLEVDFLKIDGMFVKAIVNNKIDRAMVESINNVGHVMGLHTIAEFAENNEIINILKEIGVDYAQGYGVAKPELFE